MGRTRQNTRMLPFSSCMVLCSSLRMVSSERSLESRSATWSRRPRIVSSSWAIFSLFCWLSVRVFSRETWQDNFQLVIFSFSGNKLMSFIRHEVKSAFRRDRERSSNLLKKKKSWKTLPPSVIAIAHVLAAFESPWNSNFLSSYASTSFRKSHFQPVFASQFIKDRTFLEFYLNRVWLGTANGFQQVTRSSFAGCAPRYQNW